MAKTAAPRLGKGLSAIVGTRTAPGKTPAPQTTPAPDTATPTREIPLDQIRPNARQPRQHFREAALAELAESLRTHGVVQPIVVRRIADGYELIAGERRWRAAQQAELKAIPAIIRECSDAESLELALIENLQREDLNPLERARAYRAYLDETGQTPETLAKRLAQSRANIANYMRLLNLEEHIQHMVDAGELGMGQARAIAAIADPQRQIAVAHLAIRRNLSVRQVEQLAQQQGDSKPPQPAQPDASSRQLAEVESALSRALGLPVKLAGGRKKNSGRIVIHYKNLDEFDRIATKLGLSNTLE